MLPRSFNVFKKNLIIYDKIFKFPFSSSKTPNKELIKIGNVSKTILHSNNPEFIPLGYLSKECSQETIQHLQWIMKKDLLNQDIFLIGLPGPLRRRIIFQYLEMMQREVEYVVLSRDTTESDLKQRREIKSGTAHYNDQGPVRAAIEGRVLVLDGIEKAERNVLPILNNLLENREIQLEDGRFLLSAERYDKLLLENTKKDLDNWKLVRVSENFRVVALGLPVPHFRGNPLDPPFRSRFQARNVRPSFEEQHLSLSSLGPEIPQNKLKTLLALCHTLLTDESASLGIPKVPVENLPAVVQILNKIPYIPVAHLFKWIYPYNLFLPHEGRKSVEGTLQKFGVKFEKYDSVFSIVETKSKEIRTNLHDVDFHIKGKTFSTKVHGHNDIQTVLFNKYISNKYHNTILADMLQTHLTHDFCIIGAKGSGKTVLTREFSKLLNYPNEMVMLYKDMTARDLLQQRITNEHGDTSWRPSQLVTAALKGKLVVLDGLHRLHQSTLSVIQRLIHDRELQLYDGTRLLRDDRYDTMKEKLGFNDLEMEAKNIFRIHPSFRIIALAEPPNISSFKDQWLTPEVLSMFLFHSIRPLTFKEEKYIIEQLVGPLSEKMETVLNFAHVLRNSKDDALVNISASLSTRQLMRIAHRLSLFPHENVHALIAQACLIKFLPQLAKQAMNTALENAGIDSINTSIKTKECTIKDGKVFIGSTCANIHNPGDSKVKVPDILFYNNFEHITIMEAMLQDFILGENLLLIGNQGVGKNKIADRFLQLLNRPREYIQLHRDTTVQSLTQQPSVKDGRITYDDSPLVKAIQNGHVLVVDEVDKAPTHVTCILKALVESGEMILSDGRCIVHHSDPRVQIKTKDVITMHPDFRMIVLANRPGFPFLGNDFFSTLGDIFSCHVVENPSVESEIAMLRQYGPEVPDYILVKLVRLFGELRSLSDSGTISYPYSTREVVNVVKHLEMFPDGGLPQVLSNVFDFDAYSNELQETLSSIFHKHGIPFGHSTSNINLAKEYKLSKPQLLCQWTMNTEALTCMSLVQNLKIADTCQLNVTKESVNLIEARSNSFTEQQRYWQLPLSENNIPLDVAVTRNKDSDTIHVATANPVSLISMNPDGDTLSSMDLSSFFPQVRRGFKPKVKLAALGLHLSDCLFLYEKSTNQILVLNSVTGHVSEVSMSTVLQAAMEKLSKVFNNGKTNLEEMELCSDLSKKNILIFYCLLNNKIIVLNLNMNKSLTFEMPQNVKSISALDENSILLLGDNNKFLVNISNLEKWTMTEIKEDYCINSRNFDSIESASIIEIDDLKIENIKIEKSKHLTMLGTSQDYATVAVGFPYNKNATDVFSFLREKSRLNIGTNATCILPKNAQIIRAMRPNDIPHEIKKHDTDLNSGYLEITDLLNSTYSYIPVPTPSSMTSYAHFLANAANIHLLVCPLSDERLITIDAGGCVRIWESVKSSLQTSLIKWHKLTGGGSQQQQLTIEHENAKGVTKPKYGKVDPTGAPHVGGNTWAGGTGGRDTAGLGGKGGPYRLDAGHNVFQLPDSDKNNVPPEVRKAAREMALKAYKDKLKEIEMSEHDAELYDQFSSNVQKHVKILRVILDSLQAKSKERQWLKHQTSGELDDTKLIEGITGEKSIYRRRGEQEPEMGAPQEKPKKLRIVVDVSGSMYRFNGHDNRLERELESIILVMEAFDGYQDKFQYDIVGHSGEEYCIEYVNFNSPPKNNKERLNILKKMHAHSQFCMSGDNTLEATEHAIQTISKQDADEYFVVVMSDANFDRYGISPRSFSKLLTADSKVNSFAIFIGSLGDQAEQLSKQLPAGRGFVCFDTKKLPQILQQIFTSAMLQDW